MTESKNFFTNPGVIFFIIIVIVGIGVGVYFATKNDNKGEINTVLIGDNLKFRVTYYNTSGTNLQDRFASNLEEAVTFLGERITDSETIDLKVKSYFSNDNTIAGASVNDNQDITSGGTLFLNLNSNYSYWTDVMKHELCHILGIGSNSIWNNNVLEQGGNKFLDGAVFSETLNFYNATGCYSSNNTYTDIPLNDLGDHFDEDVFDKELMTPLAETSPPHPTTRLTLTALQKIGWTVDLTNAEEPC